MAPTEVAHLTVDFHGSRGPVRAVDDLSLRLPDGKTTCLVGESGSGKSTTALAIPNLLPRSARVEGSIMFNDQDLLRAPDEDLERIRGSQIGVVFQDSLAALNPTSQVGTQIAEVLCRHTSTSRSDGQRRAVELLAEVRIPNPGGRAKDYPHQFSGGMRQRVMIAAAVACRPRLLIADEPTTALDVTVQSQILDLLRELQRQHEMSLLLVTHDMGVVAEMADFVSVMYAGQVVESGRALDVLRFPRHRYTEALLRAAPKIDSSGPSRLPEIPGQPPVLDGSSVGCRFRDRCGFQQQDCVEKDVPLVPTDPGAYLRCLHPAPAPPPNGRPLGA